MILTNILFCVLFCLGFSLSQDSQKQVHRELNLDVQDNNAMTSANGVFYYKLVLPANTTENNFNLAIRVKENDSADAGEDDFSDPDVYISKVRH
jgi:hypothetical protein